MGGGVGEKLVAPEAKVIVWVPVYKKKVPPPHMFFAGIALILSYLCSL